MDDQDHKVIVIGAQRSGKMAWQAQEVARRLALGQEVFTVDIGTPRPSLLKIVDVPDFMTHAASAAYFLADEVERSYDRTTNDGAARIGNEWVEIDGVRMALEAAGIGIEETHDRITLHLPSGGGAVDGRAFGRLFDRPLSADEFERNLNVKVGARPAVKRQPDYLRHDPTKQNRRHRPR